MNERDARRKQAWLHESSERMARAEEREGRARFFDFSRAEVLIARRPRNSHALRGVEGILSRSGCIEEAVAAHGRAKPTESRDGATAAMVDREGSREKLPRRGAEVRARWVKFTLGGQRGPLGPSASRAAKR